MKSLLIFLVFVSVHISAQGAAPAKILLEAEDGLLDAGRMEVVEQESFKSGRGVSLKPGIEPAVDSADAPADLVLSVRAEQAGRYVVRTHAAVDAAGRELMSKAKSKHESMFLKIAVGDAPATTRVVFVPWGRPESNVQTIGKFDLSGEDEQIRLWLPSGVRLDYVEVLPYVPPRVPKDAAAYQPAIVPPASRPRLWVNAQTLPNVRANLTAGDNAAVWKKLQAEAAKPYEFVAQPGVGIGHIPALETAAVNKAFIYLMTGDKASGREAVKLIRDYLEVVEFGNLLDITREIGRAMYAGARVYDWCYDLMSDEDRDSIRGDLMRLADDMEIGWPPFKQGVVNGHGSEAQLFCHLLSMAIAIYDEDPVPYQYCAYRILEELVPMRDFEYQSPRHHQGIGYGIYRFTWDMHAAWLMYRMSGQKIFDSNIEDVHKYWLYMRLPNGKSFPDGDGNVDDRRTNFGALGLLTAAYTKDPIMNGLYKKQGGLPNDPVLHLLLNDPGLPAVDDSSSLPLTLDFGRIRGGMVARTGWDLSKDSADALVMMTGGGYHFANHQQADAGSFQIYYRGMQVSDLGQYVFYGTPYDVNFNKRSIAHSMMLAYDPDEVISGRRLNDGGTRFGFPSPASPEVVKKNPMYRNGEVLSSDFGPDKDNPEFTYFSVDLASAYSDKIRNYVRTFCFVNLQNDETPGALIVVDHMETSGSDTRKYWQVNTLKPPKVTSETVMLRNDEGRKAGYVSVNMLRPEPENRKLEVMSGEDANSVFGHELTPPKPTGPQANGHRLMFSPMKKQDTDSFLTVMTMSAAEQTSVGVDLVETPEAYVLSLVDRMVVLSKTGELLKGPVTINVSGTGEQQLFVGGLSPGSWVVSRASGDVHQEAEVLKGQNTGYFKVSAGLLTVSRK